MVFNLLRRLADRFEPQEKRDRTSRDPYLAELFGVRQTAAGEMVTPERATGVAAVHACVQLIAETVASLPIAPYRRLTNGDREIDRAHPLYTVLHEQANQVQTAFEFREQLLASVLLTGNAFALKVIDARGAVTQLIPLHPDHVRAELLTNGRVRYQVSEPTSGTRTYIQDEILHVRYRSRDGFTGISPITVARETIGVALAQQQYEGAFYKNGGAVSGTLNHPATLDEESADRLKASFRKEITGANRFNLLVLEEGMKFEPIALNHEDAQFVESRKLTLEDIARIYRVPPPSIGILDKATYSNISEQSRALVAYTLRPWLVRVEQAMNMSLLTEDGRRTHFIEHNFEGLLRGNQKERYEAYRIGREWGWLSANEIRRLENQNAVTGGDVYLAPMNSQPASAEVTQ